MNLLVGIALLAASLVLLALQRRRAKALLGGNFPVDVQQGFAAIDLAADGLLAGRELTDGAIEECGAAFSRLFEFLSQRYGTEDNCQFGPDRVTFYLYCIKLAALEHPDHGAWPFKARLRAGLAQSLLREVESSADAWRHLAWVTPALLTRDVAAAERLYRKLPPVLARLALQWVNETLIGHKEFNDVSSSQALLRSLGARAPSIPPRTQDPLTSEQRWALSVTVDPSYALDARAGLADPLPPAVCRWILDRTWEIDDAESAVEQLEWLRDEGHRTQLAEELERLNTGELEPAKRAFLAAHERRLREYGILAIDLCRLIGLARTAYKAGYIDEPTAWRFILPAAQTLRSTYPSWCALGEDDLLGDRYLAENNQAESNIEASVEWLKQSPSSPWQVLEWQPTRLPQ
ncbi:MAG TPA: DUF1266 domain-containing protein [Polyangiaceae bacterium]|nr:DUF1266 domain-containing protein [Polyangiaceae bacterium]